MENVISLIRSVFITLGVIAQLLPCRFGLTQNKWSPENEKNIYYINMPSTQYNDEFGSEDERGGLGMTAELCGNKLILRVRNFIAGAFVDGYRFEIPY